jgi:micrococcal nuclease
MCGSSFINMKSKKEKDTQTMHSIVISNHSPSVNRKKVHHIENQEMDTECDNGKLFTYHLSDYDIVGDLDEYEYLKNVNVKDTVIFKPPIKYGKVMKVYDGDTITIATKLPYPDSPIYRFSVRLNGIDSPEIKGKTEKEKELAIISRDKLHQLIYGKVVSIRNIETEKYGRVLADIYLDDLHVNKWMLDNFYAVEYYGKKKIIPDEWK